MNPMPIPKKVFLPQQLARQVLVLRLLKYHLDSASELMKSEPKTKPAVSSEPKRNACISSSFGGTRRNSSAKPSPVQNETAAKEAELPPSGSVTINPPVSSPTKTKSRYLYRHLRVRVRRRRTFSNRYLWRIYLRRCRERFIYRQIGRLNRVNKEQYGRMLARCSLYHLRRARRSYPEPVAQTRPRRNAA